MRTTVVRTPVSAPNPVVRSVVKNVRELSVLPGLIIVAIVGAVVSPAFLSAANLTLILRQSAELGIVSSPDVHPHHRKLDISLESTVGLAPMVAAWLMVPAVTGGLGSEIGPVSRSSSPWRSVS